MARKSLRRTLHLWSNGIRVGGWHLPDSILGNLQSSADLLEAMRPA